MQRSHSSESFKIRKSPTKLQAEYATKLQLMDRHLLKKQERAIQNNAYNDAIRLIAAKSEPEVVEQMTPFTPKTVIFDHPSTRRLTLRQQTAPEHLQFVLHVTSHVPVKMMLKLNEEQLKTYSLQGHKKVHLGPTITQVSLSLQMQKVGLFCSVKLLVNHMKFQPASQQKRHVKIDEQLNEFLSATRGKSFQILRSRSVTRMQQIERRKTTLTSMKQRDVATATSKNQLIHFQRQKLLYLSHVKKMSPQRVTLIHKNKQKYHSHKKQQMAHLSNLVLFAKLAMYYREEALQNSRKNLRIMKTTMLCLDFIKIIKNKFRLKMTEKARLRMVMLHSLQLMPLFIRPTAVTEAKRTILEGLVPFMDFRMMEELLSNSEYYIRKVSVIQAYFKKKSREYRERTLIILERLLYKLKVDLTPQQKIEISDRYVKRCLTKSKGAVQFHSNIDLLIKMILEAP